MNKGEIVETGDAENLYEQPQSGYTKELIDAIPKIRPEWIMWLRIGALIKKMRLRVKIPPCSKAVKGRNGIRRKYIKSQKKTCDTPVYSIFAAFLSWVTDTGAVRPGETGIQKEEKQHVFSCCHCWFYSTSGHVISYKIFLSTWSFHNLSSISLST